MLASLLCCGIILSFVSFSWYSRNIFRRLSSISAAMDNLENNNFETELTDDFDDEITALTRSFNKMNYRLKELVFSPMTYRLVSPYEGEHCVIERVSEDKSHAIVAAYDIHPRFSENIHPTRLQGLDADARYRVKEICLMPDARSGMYFNDRVYTGDYLMKVGLKMLTGGELSSRIIELVKE